MNIKSIFASIAAFFSKAPVPTSAQVSQGATNALSTATAASGLAAAVAAKDPAAIIASAVTTAQAVAVDIQDIKSDIDAAKK